MGNDVIKILIVDDEEGVLDSISLYLSLARVKFAISKARSGDEAMKVLKNSSDFNVVITDIKMPGKVDGFNLVTYLRRTNPGMKILIITACDDYSDDELMKSGTDLLLRKPFTSKTLLKSIDELIALTVRS